MKDITENIINYLIEKGENLRKEKIQDRKFYVNKDNPTLENGVNELLRNIDKYPHAIVLGCLLTRKTRAEKSMETPYMISQEIGGFEFSHLLKLSQKEIADIFDKHRFSHYYKVDAETFYLAIQKIHKDYNDDASNLWNDCPSSATIVKRIREFKGAGQKIGSMIPNILVREFKIKLKDYHYIDISYDTHIETVFKRLGIVPTDAGMDDVVYRARELYPDYPGVFDLPCWEIGKSYCFEKNPNCEECEMREVCEKNFTIV